MSKRKQLEKLWVIFFKGDSRESASFCFWNGHLEAYESKKEAIAALDNEVKHWNAEKRKYKIVKAELKEIGNSKIR
jgi:hypothetical protein